MSISYPNFAHSQTFTVADFAIDTAQTPLALLGRGASAYSPSVAQNFHWLLENFANTTSTSLNALLPPKGQLWYDTTNAQLKVNIGTSGTPSWSALAWDGDLTQFIQSNSNAGTVLYIRNPTSAAATSAILQLGTGTTNGYVNVAVADNSASPYFQIAAASAVTTAYYDITTQVFRTQAGSSERMRIDSSGRLLLGYAADVGGGERFQVNGAGNFALGVTTGANSTLTTSTNALLRQTVNNTSNGASAIASLLLQTGTTNSWVDIRVNDNAGGPAHQVLAGAGIPSSYHDFDTQIFRTRAGTEKLRFDSSSRLLLGYTADQGGGQQLQMSGSALIAGNLTVSGSLSVSSGTFLAGDDNLLVNPAMEIDQRFSGASQALGTGTAVKVCDGWKSSFTGVATGVTLQQVATAPAGFKNALKVTIGTGSATVNAGDFLLITQTLEGNNVIDLAYGVAGAVASSLSFWVNCSITGTFSYSLRNNAGARSRVGQFTISSANTWTQITIPNITGDTTGTWPTDNTGSAILSIALMCGSTLSTASTAWQAGNLVNITGGTNLAATTGATFQLTGVKWQTGVNCTPFVRRKISAELAICERYYYRRNFVTNEIIANVQCYSAGSGTGKLFDYPYPMRVGATVSSSGPSTFQLGNANGALGGAFTGLTWFGYQNAACINAATGSAATPTAGQCVLFYANASAWIDADASF